MSDQEPGVPPEPTPAPSSPPPPPAEAPGAATKDERTWALFAHLSGIIFWFLGPLVIYLVQKDQMPFVKDQAREALNWQLTLLIGWVAAGVLSFIAIGFILYLALPILNLIFSIMGAIKANEGDTYRYPFSIKMVS